MDVLVTQEHRFEQTPDGRVWTRAAFARPFYSHYLKVFDGVKVVARTRPVTAPPENAQRADGDGVVFHPVPYYVGPKEFLLRAQAVRRALRSSVSGDRNAVVLRVGSQIATSIEPVLNKAHRPYALEVMCDPYEIFAPGCVEHPLRAAFRRYFSSQLKKQCLRAPMVSYVTERSLQSRYPVGNGALSVACSDVELCEEAFLKTARPPRLPGTTTIITVGSLEQPYKGVDTLIEVVRSCVHSGLDLRLVVVGDGRYREVLQAQAEGLGDRVAFLGWISSKVELRQQLDHADLFVLASRTEGLPRALLEAMARGLPCIASNVGGIPELLCESDLVPAADPVALANKIREVITVPNRLESMSQRNNRRAFDFRDEKLRGSRIEFYRKLKSITEEWIRHSATAGATTYHSPHLSRR